MDVNYFGAGETKILLTLFIMFFSAKLMAELFERIRQPAVAGEILAGVLIGPSLLGLAAPSELTDLLAEIGVIFLLFTVGLETKPGAIVKVGKQAAICGCTRNCCAAFLRLAFDEGLGNERNRSALRGYSNGCNLGRHNGASLSEYGTVRRTDSSNYSRRGSH